MMHRSHIILLLVGGLLGINIFIWNSVYAAEKGILSISFFDVGQGDAIFIESPTGTQVLVDGGRDRSVLRELGKVMSFRDRTIDMIVATHPDADHIGGLPDVLDRYEVSAVMVSGNEADTSVYKAFGEAVEEEDAKMITARTGMQIELGRGVVAEVLFPTHDVAGIDANAASIVLRVSHGATEVLLTGDAPEAIEEHLVSLFGNTMDVDILKLGHHGSDTSSSELFLAATNPEIAIVSAGEDNRYGHPDPEVIERVQDAGAEILSTATSDTITVESDGEKYWIK